MSRCTAPVEGHRSSSAAANCPACRGRRSYGYGRSSYSAPSYSNSVPAHQSRPSVSSGGSPRRQCAAEVVVG